MFYAIPGQRRIARPAAGFVIVLSTLLLTVATTGMAQSEDQTEQLNVPDVPPGRYIHEGDMLLTERQQSSLEQQGTFEANLWPGGIVPYEFETNSTASVNLVSAVGIAFVAGSPPAITSLFTDLSTVGIQVGDEIRVNGSISNNNNSASNPGYVVTGVMAGQLTLTTGDPINTENNTGLPIQIYSTRTVTPLNQTRFQNAMVGWEAVANVDFRLRTTESDYVRVQNSNFNRSAVGHEGGQQVLEMRNWWSQPIIQHEAAHTLAVKHEQSRPDRDTYVDIRLGNVSQTACSGPCDGNFNISPTARAYPTGPDGVYDFDSVMHYGAKAFTTNPDSNTIVVREPWTSEWQTRIGQRSHLSYWDQKVMSFLYPQSDWRFLHAATSAPINTGGFVTPYDSLPVAMALIPSGGHLIMLYPETFVEPGVYTKTMVMEAPLGAVITGQ